MKIRKKIREPAAAENPRKISCAGGGAYEDPDIVVMPPDLDPRRLGFRLRILIPEGPGRV